VAKDSQGRCWWYITLANKDGGTVDGWVCEKDHRLTQWCGPWDWPGFEQIDGSSHTPLDLLRRYLFTRQLILADEDQEKFKASALEVNEGPLIKQLTKAIDANHDGNVTAQELARAQQVQWSAEAISHLVVRSRKRVGRRYGQVGLAVTADAAIAFPLEVGDATDRDVAVVGQRQGHRGVSAGHQAVALSSDRVGGEFYLMCQEKTGHEPGIAFFLL
jgi:hypothetical protein